MESFVATVSAIWPLLLLIGGVGSAVAKFLVDAATLREHRLTIQKLKNELQSADHRISLATLDEIEKFGSSKNRSSKSQWVFPVLLVAMMMPLVITRLPDALETGPAPQLLATSAGRPSMILVAEEERVRLLDLESFETVYETNVFGLVQSIAFNPSGEVIAAAVSGMGIRIMDGFTGETISEKYLETDPPRIYAISFLDDERLLVYGNGQLLMVDVRSGESTIFPGDRVN